MELRHLHHFAVLAESGSLHSAARRLTLRQPALSHSIRSLEADIGTRLVERSPTGTRLTQAGSAFLNEIQPLLTALDRAVHTARIAANVLPLLHLGVSANTATVRLTALVRKFQETMPQNSVVISDGSAIHLLALLDSGLLDIALLPAAAMVGYNGGREILWKEELHLALSKTHYLADRAEIDLQCLKEEAVIVGNSREPGGVDQVLLEGCLIAGVAPQIVATAEHQEVRLALVAAGIGLTALSPSRLEIGTESSVICRPTRPPLYLNIGAAWPVTGPTMSARRFLDIARILTTI